MGGSRPTHRAHGPAADPGQPDRNRAPEPILAQHGTGRWPPDSARWPGPATVRPPEARPAMRHPPRSGPPGPARPARPERPAGLGLSAGPAAGRRAPEKARCGPRADEEPGPDAGHPVQALAVLRMARGPRDPPRSSWPAPRPTRGSRASSSAPARSASMRSSGPERAGQCQDAVAMGGRGARRKVGRGAGSRPAPRPAGRATSAPPGPPGRARGAAAARGARRRTCRHGRGGGSGAGIRKCAGGGRETRGRRAADAKVASS